MTKKNTDIDRVVLAIVAGLVIFGCVNLWSISSDWTSVPLNCIKQSIWVLLSIFICTILRFIDSKIYASYSIYLYISTIILLICTLFFGTSVSGHSSWLRIAGVGGQPTEITKFTTALFVAHTISNDYNQKPTFAKKIFIIFIILTPIALILKQGDMGSGVVFLSFGLVLLVENYFVKVTAAGIYIATFSILALLLPKSYLSIAILCVCIFMISLFITNPQKILATVSICIATLCITHGTDIVVNNLLKPYQKNRILTWSNPTNDPLGISWNINQSKIAIGSGGFWGKGLFNNTQTRYGFVPEKHTDFIFCTIGEQYGWLGCATIIVLFVVLICRVIVIAERQRLHFARIYGYSVGSFLLFHFTVNVGMTIGMMPVIGIPLPFVSYGGSALITFLIMIFVLLKLDSERNQHLSTTTRTFA